VAFGQTDNSPEGVDSNDDKYLLWLLAPINFDKTAILENATVASFTNYAERLLWAFAVALL